jgi:hypothetical protein
MNKTPWRSGDVEEARPIIPRQGWKKVLEDMSETEIVELENVYKCKIRRPTEQDKESFKIELSRENKTEENVLNNITMSRRRKYQGRDARGLSYGHNNREAQKRAIEFNSEQRKQT